MNKKTERYESGRFGKPITWPAPTPRRERIAAGLYHKPPTVPVLATVAPLPKKLRKIMTRMATGDTLRPQGLFRLIGGAYRLLCKVKKHLIARLEEMKLIEYVIGWRLTTLGRAAIGLPPVFDATKPGAILAAKARRAV